MRKIETHLGCRKRNSTKASKTILQVPRMNAHPAILMFFVIGCLATILIAGDKDVYGASGISISPSRVDYGPVPVGGSGDRIITITNTGKQPFFLLEVPKWAPPNRPWLSLVADSCTDQTLPKPTTGEKSCSITYRFSPML